MLCLWWGWCVCTFVVVGVVRLYKKSHSLAPRFVHMHHLHKPTTESFGFWHPPTEVWYTKDETAHRICNDSGEDPHCSDKYILVRGFLVVCPMCVWMDRMIDR